MDTNGVRFYQFFVNMADSERYKANFLSFGVTEINMNLADNLCAKFHINNFTDYNNFAKILLRNTTQNGKHNQFSIH